MAKLKWALWITGGLVLALLAGYLYGWWGASTFEQQRDRALLRLHLSQATALVLDARVSVYTKNFGDASQQLDQAKHYIAGARPLLQRRGSRDQIPNLDQAAKLIEQAQALTREFNQDANSQAEQAVERLRKVYQATPSPEGAS
ncbi:MAG: hypothetical protein GEV06_12325 [Luteitalea sp.]|nr:hypothetical protein [Luteitalea sp.]